jgi:hypothetical protein
MRRILAAASAFLLGALTPAAAPLPNKIIITNPRKGFGPSPTPDGNRRPSRLDKLYRRFRKFRDYSKQRFCPPWLTRTQYEELALFRIQEARRKRIRKRLQKEQSVSHCKRLKGDRKMALYRLFTAATTNFSDLAFRTRRRYSFRRLFHEAAALAQSQF